MTDKITQLTNEFLFTTIELLKIDGERKDARIAELLADCECLRDSDNANARDLKIAEERIAELEALLSKRPQNDNNWRRAIVTQPPLNRDLLINDTFYGVTQGQFDVVNGELLYHKLNSFYWSKVTNDTLWAELPGDVV